MKRWIFKTVITFITVLFLIKTAFFFLMREHLFETHYWFDVGMDAWNAELWTFNLFLLFLISSFFYLSRVFSKESQCRSYSLKSLVFLIPGFVFFMSANFNIKNLGYIYTAFSGLLTSEDLGYCLVTDFFFRKPYLFYYCTGFLAVFYILIRTGKTKWFGYICTFFFILFFGMNSSFFYYSVWTYLLLFVIGIVSFIAGLWIYKDNSMPVFLQLYPFYPFILMNILFYQCPHYKKSVLGVPLYYPSIIMILIVTGVLAIRYFFKNSHFYNSLSCFIPFYSTAFFFHCSVYYPNYININRLFFYSQTLYYYIAFEVLIVALMVAFSFVLLRNRKSKITYIVVTSIILFIIIVSCFDFRSYQLTGVRLNWKMMFRGGIEENPGLIIEILKKELTFGVLFVLGIISGIYFLIRYFVEKNYENLVGWRNLAFCLCIFLMFFWLKPLVFVSDQLDGHIFSNLISTSPMMSIMKYRKFSAEEFKTKAGKLEIFPEKENESGTLKKMNVLLIILESSHSRYLSLFNGTDETQPMLSEYKDRMEIFTNFYSSFPDSFHARVSSFSSLYLVQEYLSKFNKSIPVKTLFEILKELDYKNSIFISSYIKYCGLDQFLMDRKVDLIQDSFNMPEKEKFKKFIWGIDEKATLKTIQNRLKEHKKKDENFFITYIPSVPHYPYDGSDIRFIKFKPKQQKTDFNSAHLEKLLCSYKNGLLYMDWIVTSIIKELETNGQLGKTIVIITCDHGEMLGENGKLGHGFDLYPDISLVPLIIMNPDRHGYKVNKNLSSHISILPTVLDALNIKMPEGLYQGVSLYGDKKLKSLYLSSYGDSAIVKDSRYYLEKNSRTGQKSYQTFNIENKANKTIFTKISESKKNTEIEKEIADFVEFQNSFLRYYSTYVQGIKSE